MRKKLRISVCLVAVLLSTFMTTTAGAAGISVQVDTKNIAFPDADPYVNQDDRTMVPVRFVAEALGAKVFWEKDGKQTVTIEQGKKILLKIGESKATVNGQERTFDTQAVIKQDRTFVPLRFISEALNCEVFWTGNKNLVEVFYKKISCGDVILDKDDSTIKGMDIASDETFRSEGKSYIICGIGIVYGEISGVAPLEQRLEKTKKILLNFADKETVNQIMDFVSQKKDDKTRLGEKVFESEIYKIEVNGGYDGLDIHIFKK